MTTDTEKLLEERAKTHGEYAEHARITQGIMDLIMSGRNWPRLTPIQRESLHMFAHKIGRICEGDPNHADHWDDIAGYAVLVSQRLPKPPVAAEIRRAVGVGTGPGRGIPVHAVGDPDNAGLLRAARPVPVEDSNRHADRAGGPPMHLRDAVNAYEYDNLPPEDRGWYSWNSERQEWRL